MAKKLTIGGLFLLVFLTSIIITFQVINRDNQELTMEFEEPSLPIIELEYEDSRCNVLYGYTEEMDMVSVAEYIMDVGVERTITGTLISTDSNIESLTMQVRNMDATRLIEEQSIAFLESENLQYDFSFSFHDLIELGEEYIIHFIVGYQNGSEVHYYTRIWYVEDSVTTEQIAYVKQFHDNSYDKTMRSEIASVLETNSTQANRDLSYTNIYSSTDQVMYGTLDVIRTSLPQLAITYLDEQYGGYTLTYTAVTRDSEQEHNYKIIEKYIVRTIGDKLYLMDFERTMDSVIDLEHYSFDGNTIDLGVSIDSPIIYESEDGKMAAFVKNSSLYLYDDNENLFKKIYTSYVDGVEEDVLLNDQQNIKVLRIDESGSMYFIVYGYFNSGRYEGKTGVILYSYDGSGNIIKEIAMFESNKHPALVMQEIEQYSYMNHEGNFYFLYEGNIWRYNLNTGKSEVWIPYREDATLLFSPNHSSILREVNQVLFVYDMEEDKVQELTTQEGEINLVQGYIGEDFLYGVVNEKDYIKNPDGSISYLMKKLLIQNIDGKVKKEYQRDDVFIEDTLIEGTQIIIDCLERTTDGYEDVADDYIMSNTTISTGENTINEVYLADYQTVKQVQLMNNVNNSTLEKKTAVELLYEGSKVVSMQADKTADYNLVSAGSGTKSYTTSPGDGLIAAYDSEGFVRNSTGSYVWKYATSSTVNQIMAITQPEVCEASDSLRVCLNTMLAQMNNPRDTGLELEQGMSCQDILSSSMLDYDFIDATGANMKSMLYYLNMDIPVLAILENGEAVLLTGYNQFNIVIFEPTTGTLYKKGLNDATDWFAEQGNRFMTFYRYKTN